jgi:predicted RNA-binding protein with RPS1 domain
MRGPIVNIKKFGAFIETRGTEGLIHTNDLA